MKENNNKKPDDRLSKSSKINKNKAKQRSKENIVDAPSDSGGNIKSDNKINESSKTTDQERNSNIKCPSSEKQKQNSNKKCPSSEKTQKHIMLKVFISYSRGHDHVIAGLLAHALKEQGFDVFYDRRLFAGFNIVQNISQYISDSHAVILLLSKNSVNSAWANQEIGYALSCNKPIIPIQVDSGELQPVGMLREINSLEFNLTDWFNSTISINKLKRIIYEAVDKKETCASVITTKIERTQKIIGAFTYLNELLDKNKCKNNRQKVMLKLYKRTSVSIFSVKEPLKEETHRYNSKYWALLCKQRKTIEEFMRQPDVKEVRLHLCPQDYVSKDQSDIYDNLKKLLEDCKKNSEKLIKDYMKKDDMEILRMHLCPQGNANTDQSDRIKNLIDFLKNCEDAIKEKLKIKLEKHGQTNIVAVDNHFVFEGIKPRKDNEYLYTLHWLYPSSMVREHFSNVDRNWDSLRDDGDKILDKLETVCKKCTGCKNCSYNYCPYVAKNECT